MWRSHLLLSPAQTKNKQTNKQTIKPKKKTQKHKKQKHRETSTIERMCRGGSAPALRGGHETGNGTRQCTLRDVRTCGGRSAASVPKQASDHPPRGCHPCPAPFSLPHTDVTRTGLPCPSSCTRFQRVRGARRDARARWLGWVGSIQSIINSRPLSPFAGSAGPCTTHCLQSKFFYSSRLL